MFRGTRNSGQILRGLLLAMVLPVIVAVPAGARSDAVACKAPTGTAALLAQEKKIIVFGEYHGTREMPALVGEVACAAAAAGTSVTVALEIPESEQPLLARFLAGTLDESGVLNGFHADSGTISVRQTKTGKSRSIILAPEGVTYFKRLILGREATAPLFPREEGGRWAKSQQTPRLVEACKNARLKPAIGFHGLRHTYASLMVMNGAPLHVVSENLGHADERMVQRHYGHLADSYKRKIIHRTAPSFGLDKAKAPDLTVVSSDDDKAAS